MIWKLTMLHIKKLCSRLWPVSLILLALIFLMAITSNWLSVVFMVAGLLILLGFTCALVLSFWQSIHQSLFGRQSYLLRTVPASLNTMYLSLVMFGLFCLAVFALLVVLFGYTAVNATDASLQIQGISDAYGVDAPVLFIVMLCLQMASILYSGMSGILFGYASSKNKLIRSLLIGLVFYYGFSIVSVLLAFIVYTGFSWDTMITLFTSDAVPLKLLYWVAGFYGFSSAVQLVIDGWKIHQGIDVDG